MSTIYVAVIIIAITVIPPYLFIRFSKRQEQKDRDALFSQFNQAGRDHGLSFTRLEVLKDKILGFDAGKQSLLLLSFDPAGSPVVIGLSNVQTCTLHRKYITLDSSNGQAKAEMITDQIGIRLTLSHSADSAWISFYDTNVNGIYQMQELEQKAKFWEGLINQHISSKMTRRA